MNQWHQCSYWHQCVTDLVGLLLLLQGEQHLEGAHTIIFYQMRYKYRQILNSLCLFFDSPSTDENTYSTKTLPPCRLWMQPVGSTGQVFKLEWDCAVSISQVGDCRPCKNKVRYPVVLAPCSWVELLSWWFVCFLLILQIWMEFQQSSFSGFYSSCYHSLAGVSL